MTTQANISILIVNFNSTDFVECSLLVLKSITKNTYKVFITDNGSKKSEYQKLLKITKNHPNVSVFRNETNLIGSIAHGTALNELIQKVDTPYFSILDADATWLKKNWDDILIQKMSNTVKVIGTQAPPPKQQDFPLMFAILFETETFKKLNIDFRPKNLNIHQDTGWELREKYHQAGYGGLNIDFKNTRTYKTGPFADIQAVGEFYLDGHYSEIFASHFGRGSNPLGKQTFLSKNRLLRCLILPINYLLWLRNRRRWITICQRLVSKQCN